MNFITSIPFLVILICSATIPIHGENRGNRLIEHDDYLDFHINKIRMKRQVPSEATIQNTPLDSVAMGDIQNIDPIATQQNVEMTQVKEENRRLNKMISDLRIKNTDLEARNGQLEKQYQQILKESQINAANHVTEITMLREEINNLRVEMEGILVELQTLMDAKLSLELEIAAYRKLLETGPGRVHNNQTTLQSESSRLQEENIII